MGHYTGFKGKLVLSADLPESYLAVLKYMLFQDGSRSDYDGKFLPGFENHLENLLVSIQDEPNTAYFTSEDWASLLIRGESVYFPYGQERKAEKNELYSLTQRVDGRYDLVWASAGRHTSDQLENFIHWLVPYLDNEGSEEPILIAQSCFEHSNSLHELFLIGDKVHAAGLIEELVSKEEGFVGFYTSRDDDPHRQYNYFSESPELLNGKRDFEKMMERATILRADGIEYGKQQWSATLAGRNFSLRQFRDSRRMVTGIEPLDDALDGGLEMSKTSLWFAPPKNFGQGHLVNMMVDAVINNRPPTGVYYRVCMMVSHMDIEPIAAMIYQRLFLHKTGQVADPITVEATAMRQFIMDTLKSLGWQMSLLAPNPGHVDGNVLADILNQVNDRDLTNLKLVVVDSIDGLGNMAKTGERNLSEFNIVRNRYDFHLAVGAALPDNTNRSFRSGDWYGRDIEWLEHVVANDMLDSAMAAHADMTFVQRMEEGKVYFTTSRIGVNKKSFEVGLTPELIYQRGNS